MTVMGASSTSQSCNVLTAACLKANRDVADAVIGVVFLADTPVGPQYESQPQAQECQQNGDAGARQCQPAATNRFRGLNAVFG